MKQQSKSVYHNYTDWNEVNAINENYKQQWSVYLSNKLQYNDYDEHIWHTVLQRCNAHKSLIAPKDIMFIRQGGVFFFETQKEMEQFFNIFNEPPVYNSDIFVAAYDTKGYVISQNKCLN